MARLPRVDVPAAICAPVFMGDDFEIREIDLGVEALERRDHQRRGLVACGDMDREHRRKVGVAVGAPDREHARADQQRPEVTRRERRLRHQNDDHDYDGGPGRQAGEKGQDQPDPPASQLRMQERLDPSDPLRTSSRRGPGSASLPGSADGERVGVVGNRAPGRVHKLGGESRGLWAWPVRHRTRAPRVLPTRPSERSPAALPTPPR